MADEQETQDQGGERPANEAPQDKPNSLTEDAVSEWLREEKGIKNIDGLHSALQDEREARKEMEKRLRSLEGVDPEEYRALKEAAEQREAEQLKNEGRWEDMKARLTEAHSKELTSLQSEVQKRDALIERLTVENELNRAIEEADVLPQHRKAVRALLKTEAAPEIEWDGDSARGTMGGVPIAEYVESWAKTDEAAPYLPSSGASGSGARGGSNGRAPSKPFSELSRAEKIEWRANHSHEEFLEQMAAMRAAQRQ